MFVTGDIICAYNSKKHEKVVKKGRKTHFLKKCVLNMSEVLLKLYICIDMGYFVIGLQRICLVSLLTKVIKKIAKKMPF